MNNCMVGIRFCSAETFHNIFKQNVLKCLKQSGVYWGEDGDFEKLCVSVVIAAVAKPPLGNF